MYVRNCLPPPKKLKEVMSNPSPIIIPVVLSGGMGTAAFVAFLMSLCDPRYTATQFALLTAFASLGRVFVGPPSGIIAEQLGWVSFFGITFLTAIPGLVLLWIMSKSIKKLEKKHFIKD